MIVNLNAQVLLKELNNITNYSIGFLEGAEAAKPIFMDNLGQTVIESLKSFIDSNARVTPDTLHHVYEWYQTGSPEARLFDINYVSNSNGLSFNYTFSQSSSVSKNSKTPFYDKARIMEEGSPVTIRPKSKGGVLTFNQDGEQVFTQKPIVVENPGGDGVQGGFEKTIKLFFDNYFTQAFLMSSGVMSHFNDVKVYKNNFRAGSRQGKPLGFKIGYEWMAKGGKID